MSYSLVKLSVKHSSVINIEELNKLVSEGETEISDLEEKIENLNTEIEDLQDEIDSIKDDQKGLDDESNDYMLNQVVISEKENEIKQKESEIEPLQKELDEWKADVKHLEAVTNESENYRAENLICANVIDSHIESEVRESNSVELEGLSNLIKSNINWSGIVEDCKSDYSQLTLDGCDYFYLAG